MSIRRKPTNQYKSTDGEIPAVRWYNRRRLAWFSFYGLVGGTFIYWFLLPLWFTLFGLNLSWLALIGESYSWFASTLTVIVTGYMGIEYMIRARTPAAPSMGNQQHEEETEEIAQEELELEDPVTEEIYDPERK